MNEELPADETANMEPKDMLNRLQAHAGRWHDLAKLIPALISKGYDATSIDEITGVNPAQQNKWVVSATVYESLKGVLDPDVLAKFDSNGEELLYSFRFLSAERRVEAANYLLEQRFDADMCDVLARAMKEFERRPTERYGFTDHPADCLAFKYLRDAGECRKREDIEEKLRQALKVALTDGARERVLALLQEQAEGGSSRPTVSASLNILRLNPDEMGTRPVCVLGELGQVGLEALDAAPKTSQRGAFDMFRLEAGGKGGAWDWVALPQWRALAMARHPVAFTIPDCSQVTAIIQGAKCKTDEDKRRLIGPGMLVCDKARAAFAAELTEEAWYLVASAGSRTLTLLDGGRVADMGDRAHIAAQVLFLARPPVKEMPNQGTELLQL